MLRQTDRQLKHGPFVASTFALLLNACAIPNTIDVSSSGAAFGPVTTLHLPVVEDDVPQRSEFATALQSSFTRHSVTMSDKAHLVAEYALAVRPAETGLADPHAQPDNSKDVHWSSKPRDKRLLDKCTALRLRATLVLLERSSGLIVYRGEGETNGCEAEPATLNDLAERLVADVLLKGAS